MSTPERADILIRFGGELDKASGDGQKKRQKGVKPPWYIDPDHHVAMFSHYRKWLAGELVDPDSGGHPLVHLAWRALAIACIETGNVPEHSGPTCVCGEINMRHCPIHSEGFR